MSEAAERIFCGAVLPLRPLRWVPSPPSGPAKWRPSSAPRARSITAFLICWNTAATPAASIGPGILNSSQLGPVQWRRRVDQLEGPGRHRPSARILHRSTPDDDHLPDLRQAHASAGAALHAPCRQR